MTVQEVQNAVKELQAQGWEKEEILGAFYAMFQDEKINVDELGALCEVLGYKLTEEFKNMSPEDQKTKGYEETDEAEEGVSEEEIEDAKETDAESEEEKSGSDSEGSDEESEEEKEKRARKLYGYDE